MLPFLINWGLIQFRTLNLFLILGFIAAGFLFWRKAREEHYEESEIFDGFLLSSLVGLIASRAGFIILQFSQFGGDVWRWFNIIGAPGFNVLIGGAAAALFMYRFGLKKKWDVFEVVDFWTLAISFALGVLWIGMFLDGTSFGHATQLPWGILFPGVLEKHHPIQLYFAAMYFGLFYYLSWADYHYRTFNWYRAGKNTAQTGFMTSVFLISTAGFSFLMTFFRPTQFVVQGISLDAIIYGLLTLAGLYLLYTRSGRSIVSPRRRQANRENTPLIPR